MRIFRESNPKGTQAALIWSTKPQMLLPHWSETLPVEKGGHMACSCGANLGANQSIGWTRFYCVHKYVPMHVLKSQGIIHEQVAKGMANIPLDLYKRHAKVQPVIHLKNLNVPLFQKQNLNVPQWILPSHKLDKDIYFFFFFLNV